MRESNFSQRLVRSLRDVGALVHRIENTVLSGLPDIYCAFNSRQFWIETKVTLKPTHEPRFERNQKMVMEQLVMHGVPVFVVIGSEDAIRVRSMTLEPGTVIELTVSSIHEATSFILSHVRDNSDGI